MNIAHTDTSIAAKLGALSHPARLEILRVLSTSGRCCCGDVVASLDLAQSTVSQHLKVLVEAGLVTYSPDRQRSCYAIDRSAVGALAESFAGLMQACCGQASDSRQGHSRGN